MQRDSSSLLDLEAKAPEELHLRFGPVTGITPSLPEPRVRRTSPAGMPVPPAAAASGRRAEAGSQGSHGTGGSAGRAPRSAAAQAAPVQPRLNLRERDPEDSSPTTKFTAQATASGMKARYWIYGLAIGLGAAGLVAAGYSAAFVQLTLRDDRATALQTSTAAATDTRAATAVPAPAAPGRAASPVLTEPRAANLAEPNEPADEPGFSTGARSKQNNARTHAGRTRNVAPGSAEPSFPSAAAVDLSAEETFAVAPRMEPNPIPAEVPAASAPAPRLIITPLPDLPEPSAPEATSPAATSSAPEPTNPASEPAAVAPKPAPAAQPTPSAAPEPSGPQENLPAQLSREDIQQHLLGMRDKLATCAGNQHGTSYANVTINGNGRVSYSTIDGAFAGSPAGSCMARTLRGATFPRFSGPQMTVRYPYVF